MKEKLNRELKEHHPPCALNLQPLRGILLFFTMVVVVVVLLNVGIYPNMQCVVPSATATDVGCESQSHRMNGILVVGTHS